MRYVLAALAAFALSAFATHRSQEQPGGSSGVPQEYVKKTNPVKPTPAGLTEARRVYGFDCAMCHGKEGDGKGDLAADMKLELKDWRDPASLEKMTDGELFYIISKGKGKMPGEGERAKETQIWEFVNLVRSFARKKD
ncbi:MAG TPA: cytochrome c [Methylomirabilota bacterium]|nr:cytochrome c [Methylomirabilota bacterium]